MIEVKHFMQLYFYYLQSRRGSAEMNLREVSMKGMKRIRDSVRLGVSEIQQQVWRMKLSLPVMRRMWRRVSNRN